MKKALALLALTMGCQSQVIARANCEGGPAIEVHLDGLFDTEGNRLSREDYRFYQDSSGINKVVRSDGASCTVEIP